MKRFLLTLALAGLSAVSLAAGDDLVFTQRSADDSAAIPRTPAHPTAGHGLMFFNFSSVRPEYALLGAGCSITSNVFTCAGTGTQAQADWSQANSGAVDFIKNKPSPFDGTWASLTGKPSTFTPSAHTHVAADISDSTATGRSVLTAASQAAARTAIGAGTSSFSGAYTDLTAVPSSFTPAAHNQAWSTITATPTTLAGYGITDGVTGTSLTSTLSGYATTAALSGKEPTISAGTTAQYWRGDKTWVAFPTIPAAQVNSDWSASSGVAQILNKPTIQTIQRTRAQSNTSGVYTWTYPSAYGAGVTPIIAVTVEDGTSATWNHQITSISNTAVTIQLTKTTAVTVLGISVLGIAASPQAFVHILAVAP